MSGAVEQSWPTGRNNSRRIPLKKALFLMPRILDRPLVPVTYKPQSYVGKRSPKKLKKNFTAPVKKKRPNNILKYGPATLREFWHCPVCGKNYTSVKTRDLHIKIHGQSRIEDALKPPTPVPSPIPHLPKNTTLSPIPLLDQIILRAPIKNACSSCGTSPAIPGDDVCYFCHPK